MRFFEKLFGSLSNSDQKNDYARATLEFATSPEIKKSNATIYTSRGLAFNAKDEYDLAILDCTKALEINTNKAIALMNVRVVGLQGPRISVTIYTSYTSKTYRYTSHC